MDEGRSCGRTSLWICCFFFQAEDGIRDLTVTGVQTCALPIFRLRPWRPPDRQAVSREPCLSWRRRARPGSCARSARSSRRPSRQLRERPSTLPRSEEHTSELQSQSNLVCRLLLEKKKKIHDRR